MLVDEWLCGAWTRDWIRRAAADGRLGAADSSVSVRYVQTPRAFVDVRTPRSPHTTEGAMAFGGVAAVEQQAGSPPLVRWHALLCFAPPCDAADGRWEAAAAGAPLPTEDEGYFERQAEAEVYLERDPAGSLEERWVRIESGGGRFLSARRGQRALLAVANDHFAVAIDGRPAEGPPVAYAAGRISAAGWRVEACLAVAGREESAASRTWREGALLTLPGGVEEWQLLEGTTMSWEELGAVFEK
ncbi:hypothetical protein AB1Y20_004936 [Prymnesium parvum]|uniref:Beta-galactosidase n=1 Tax=Prymnesium parvum TaxID=97485 RepID=A0AB34J2R2_PRYPA